MSREPVVRLEDVRFAYRDRSVLDGVSFEVERGERFGLLGPTGSGKSTLVRLLSGVLRPSAGRISVGGRDLGGYPPAELARRVAVVPQETALDFPFSVLEVVLMGRAPHLGGFGFEGDRDVEAAESAMTRTGVADLAGRFFHELSGGEKQRVVIARALAQEPEVLLLDEPTTSLDIRHVVEIFELLSALSRERGMTLVVVLHDLNLAALYLQRLAFLKHGRLYACGPPEEVMTYRTIRDVYETDVYVHRNDLTGRLNVLPLGSVTAGSRT
ncbi:MAG: ABC transporter ATP-binding protein [Deltaproteobacteria bacterium]|nr:ABC transporter ATP-binding protein [Deltaproteobacteria bacterium]